MLLQPVLVEAYFDGSVTSISPVMCVGGIVYESSQAREVSAKQATYYDNYQINHYHAVACEAGQPPFDHLPRELRSDLEGI
jgi:hypothetical protein